MEKMMWTGEEFTISDLENMNVALLVSWGSQGFDYPVYGLLKPAEFDSHDTATMYFGNGESVEVTRDNAVVLSALTCHEAFPQWVSSIRVREFMKRAVESDQP